MQPPTHALFGSLYLLCSPSEGVGCLLVLLAEADVTLNILLVIIVNVSVFGLSSPFSVSVQAFICALLRIAHAEILNLFDLCVSYHLMLL